MSLIYLLALVAVGLVLLAATVSAVVSVSRRPEWERSPARATWQLVVAEDRRRASLPFVGKDARQAATTDAARSDDRLAA